MRVSGRLVARLTALTLFTTACGSKSGLLLDEVAAPPDASPPDAGAPDTGRPDGGFDTFPCSWTYGQPLELGEALAGGDLLGAVHGRLDVAWVQSGAGRSAPPRRVSLTDPPRVLGEVSTASALPVHGLTDGWTTLAPDCSLAFFDDEGSPRRLLVPPVNAAPCSFDRLDPAAIDVSSPGAPPRYSSATRLTTRGGTVHDVASLRPLGRDPHAVVSVAGDLVMRFGRAASSEVVASLSRAAGEVLWEGPVGRVDGSFAVSLDRLRDAAVVLLPTVAGAALVRIPFDAGRLVVQPLAEFRGSVADATEGLVTNETEALVPLTDGRVAVQPLSGSALRFLPTPPEGRVLELRVLLRPGESRGGLLYVYRDPRAALHLAFRTLVCNR